VPKVTYVSHEGLETTVEGACGVSVMQTAVVNGVDGIVGECGGSMMCATCHVYIDPAWFVQTGEKSDGEDDTLEDALAPLRPTSRLSCQINLVPELDGLVVHTPEEQG
jgi:2Fe-2S ferredoxin